MDERELVGRLRRLEDRVAALEGRPRSQTAWTRIGPEHFDTLAARAERDAVCIAPALPDRYTSGDVVLNTRTGEKVIVIAGNGETINVRRGFQSMPVTMHEGDELMTVGRADS